MTIVHWIGWLALMLAAATLPVLVMTEAGLIR